MKMSAGVGRVQSLFVLALLLRATAGAAQPSSPPRSSSNVASTVLETRRISGQRVITPDADTRAQIAAAGVSKLVVPFKICIDVTGQISHVKILEPSGFAAYDAKLSAALREWRYQPYLLDGKPVPVCTSVTFVYHQMRELVDSGYLAFFAGRELRDHEGSPLLAASLRPGLAAVQTPRGSVLSDDDDLALSIVAPGLELVGWCAPQAVATVVGEPVLLAAKPQLAGTKVESRVAGVRLRAGSPVQVLEQDLNAVRVRFTAADRIAEGWIPGRMVTRLFKQAADPARAAGPEVALPPGASLLAMPKGHSLATLARSDPGAAQRAVALSRREGHVLVAIEGEQWWALGWVPQTQLLAAAQATREAKRQQASAEPPRIVSLARRTPLYSSTKGVQIGYTVEDVHLPLVEVRDGYSRISISTNVGELFVWVRSAP